MVVSCSSSLTDFGGSVYLIERNVNLRFSGNHVSIVDEGATRFTTFIILVVVTDGGLARTENFVFVLNVFWDRTSKGIDVTNRDSGKRFISRNIVVGVVGVIPPVVGCRDSDMVIVIFDLSHCRAYKQ